MKNIFSILLALSLLLASVSASIQVIALNSENDAGENTIAAIAAIEQLLSNRDYVPGQIIFRTQDGVGEFLQTAILESIDMVMDLDAIQAHGTFICTEDGSLPYFDLDFANNFFAITVPEELMRSVLIALKLNPYIKYAAPNYITKYRISDVTTDLAPEGSGTSNSGYDSLTSVYAMNLVGVKEAWEKGFTGSSSETPVVRVGVIDTGYTPHIDIDTVAYTYAYNAALNSYDYTTLTDTDGHGTAMIGIMGATLNAEGTNGVLKHSDDVQSNVRIYPIKVVGSYPSEGWDVLSEIDVAIKNALTYAQNNNLDIVSMSLGMHTNLRDAVEGIYDGLLVVPAGNDNDDIYYDSSCRGYMNDDPNWIVVGVSDSEDSIGPWPLGSEGDEWGSNWSQQYVDLFAPGYEIATTHKNETGYILASGSSCSVPFVTASAVIIMTHATQYRDNPEALIELLCATVDQQPWLSEKCVSGGRLSLINAVEYLYNEQRPRTYPGAHSKGDISGDGYIKEEDAALIKAYLLGTETLTYAQQQAADVDGNGVINVIDYSKVKKFANQTYYFPPAY